ncbi:MAG: hypothetical protein WBV69_24910 [Candidatus Sulfotelmatobacter sp.]
MKRAQRFVVVAYCLTLAYCWLWIPWCVSSRRSPCERVGYGWLWAGPVPRGGIFNGSTTEAPVPLPPPGFTFDNPEPTWERARPDLELMALRLLAGTAILGAAFLVAGMFGSAATRS